MSQARFHRPKPVPKFEIESSSAVFAVVVHRCRAYNDEYALDNSSTGFILDRNIAEAKIFLKIKTDHYSREADKAFRSTLALMNRVNDLMLVDNCAIVTQYELYLKRNGLISAHTVSVQNPGDRTNGNVLA